MVERDYKKEYQKYHGTEAYKKRRAKRNKVRRQYTRAGKVKKGDGRDIDHKVPLARGGSNGRKNLRVVRRSTNRGKDNNL